MRAFIYAVGFIAGAFGLWLLTLCLSILAGAVELSISGSFTGNGNQSLFFTGENVSAFWNGSNLSVSAVSDA
ncbi:hypothetical protein M0R72_11620 [Candidatus Pacearchaeota archaeon]|jgi:hypothetical protein|nr:hypothetical protein [Candidatus Pacearchaeota archaeon]